MATTAHEALAQETTKSKRDTKLALGPLIGIVIGSMIGSGAYSLPQNMAAGAGPAAVLIGWLITGIGVLALAFVYQDLAVRRPELNAGPYAYARAGFGSFIGFNSAWGYWLSAWLGNVSYAVLIFSALGYFWPIFGEGNTWQAIVGASACLWVIHWLALRGVHQAAFANAITTIAKVVPLILFIVLLLFAFHLRTFSVDFWGGAKLGSLFTQVKSTMLVTLWAFIGIEGASVVSARARKRPDIGRATVLGFTATLVLYVLVSVLAFGILQQGALGQLKNPSTAGVLQAAVGSWGAGLMTIGLVISVGGAFLSWTLLAAEIPFSAGRDHTMPKLFAAENDNGSPVTSLWITNGLVQLFLIVALFRQSTYYALFYTATAAILVPYVFSGAYALKLAITGESYEAEAKPRRKDMFIGLVATVYGIWLVYAAGLAYLLMVALLYAPGIIFYVVARRQNQKRLFNVWEILIAIGLVAAAIIAAVLIARGTISPL
ncbi:MAG TPA: arginine-ornithine antiporter [Gammaproteobacteria bacterium]|nr:arginine-ornithine antiporter [Gammaproteobacteria bacterium]